MRQDLHFTRSRRVLITVILKVKSSNNPPPEFQTVQVWRDGDRKRKMIRVESGIFWMDALWHHETDCEWLSLTSVCCHGARGWRSCCYYLAVILQPNKLQPNDYIGDGYTQTAKRRWRFRAHSVLVCDSSSCVGSLAGATYVISSLREKVQRHILIDTFMTAVMKLFRLKCSTEPFLAVL